MGVLIHGGIPPKSSIYRCIFHYKPFAQEQIMDFMGFDQERLGLNWKLCWTVAILEQCWIVCSGVGVIFFYHETEKLVWRKKTIDHVVSKVSKIGKGNMDEAAGPLSGHASMIFPMEKQPLFISSGCSSKPPTCWFPEAIIFSWLATREKVVNMSTIYPLGWWMGLYL